MGIMGFLRDRMGLILVIFIAVALLLFIAMDVVHYGGGFFHDDNTTIGEVGGQAITYDDFNKKVETNEDMFKQQMHSATLPPQYLSYVQETAWNQILGENILNHEMDKLGLVVGTSEQTDLIQG